MGKSLLILGASLRPLHAHLRQALETELAPLGATKIVCGIHSVLLALWTPSTEIVLEKLNRRSTMDALVLINIIRLPTP
jgi:hypothetical protein